MTFKCADCEQNVLIHAVLDSEDWVRIASDGAYCLCPPCIDRRAEQLGMKIECDLQYCGTAMQSLRTDRVKRAAAWRPREYIAMEGIGLPRLYKGLANG